MKTVFLPLSLTAATSSVETVLRTLIADPNADLGAFGADSSDYESEYEELVNVTRAPSELVEYLMSELRHPFSVCDLNAIARVFPGVTAENVYAFAVYCIEPIRGGDLNPCDSLRDDNSIWTLSDAKKIEYYKYRLRDLSDS